MMETRPSLLKPAVSSVTAVSQAGMLLCVFTCTLALLNTAADHSGHKLSAVRESFEFSLTSRGLRQAAEKPGGGGDPEKPDRNEISSEKESLRGGFIPIGRSRRRSSEFVESDELTDVNQQSFSRLVMELDRLCDVSAIRSYSGELAFDFVSVAEGTDQEAIAYSIDLMDQIQLQSGATDMDFELICWAESPQSKSLLLAVQKAAAISDQIRLQRSGERSPPLSSSGRYWTMTTEIRPTVTVVVRQNSDPSAL